MKRVLILCLVAAGCDPAPLPVGATVLFSKDFGPIQFEPMVKGRDGGFSAMIGAVSAWTFGDTNLTGAAVDGETRRASTFGVTNDLDASDGVSGLVEPLDANGAPGEFLPFAADELAFNQAHAGDPCTAGADCGARKALWPGPIVVRNGEGRLFYAKVDASAGSSTGVVGTGIASWDGQNPPSRLTIDAAASEPTVLFPNATFGGVAGAVLVEDQVYAYFCAPEFVIFACRVGRAPWDALTTASAWTFYDGLAWQADFAKAKVIMQGAAALTVHFSAHVGKYLAVFSTPLADTLELKTAAAPEGPWSSSAVFFVGKKPLVANQTDYGAIAHAEYARDGGKVEYVTYYRPGDLSGEMHLVEVTFQ